MIPHAADDLSRKGTASEWNEIWGHLDEFHPHPWHWPFFGNNYSAQWGFHRLMEWHRRVHEKVSK